MSRDLARMTALPMYRPQEPNEKMVHTLYTAVGDSIRSTILSRALWTDDQ